MNLIRKQREKKRKHWQGDSTKCWALKHIDKNIRSFECWICCFVCSCIFCVLFVIVCYFGPWCFASSFFCTWGKLEFIDSCMLYSCSCCGWCFFWIWPKPSLRITCAMQQLSTSNFLKSRPRGPERTSNFIEDWASKENHTYPYIYIAQSMANIVKVQCTFFILEIMTSLPKKINVKCFSEIRYKL